MSLFTSILTGLAMGVVFGVALEKARVFEPGMIVGQMQIKNFIMLKVFLTAVATGAVVLAALHGFGLIKLAPKATFYAADIVGGLVLGIGIALAGACPGTVLAQIGAGYRDAIFTLVGGIAGAVAFGYAEPALAPLLLTGGPGKLTFMDLTGVSYPVLSVGFAAVLVVVLVLLERWRPWRAELGADVDGDFGPAEGAPGVPASRLKPAE
ncbi:YeeE/YedE family protein [Xanthobacter autotrophicus]|uniref:YeeE/YedE thiosulfate transporter family protein n=1 Tax=Xanthobacter TaxID=279 RepID=UPI0024AB50E7|nr:YeeE/YedE thiosulfate transporter family protein [Xanthobacter autotrophicus]MDI4663420.1 YeeE/YedE family protein [Xanthobacter autotrophicus]